MAKTKMPYILFWPETNLDSIVQNLQSLKNDDYNYYFDFLGHILESDTVTLEDAYLEVYGMSREEYRKKLKESYDKYLQNLKKQTEIRREDDRLKREKVYALAKEIIPEDKMAVYEEAHDILAIRYLLDNSIQFELLDFIKYLNSSEYSLKEALTRYKKFMPRITLTNVELLRCLRELSPNGKELYDSLVDEEAVKRVEENVMKYKIAHNLDTLPGFKFPKPSEEELLTSFDIRRTTCALLGYRLNQEKETGIGLK